MALQDYMRQSLSNAGIGRTYHDRSLDEFKEFREIGDLLINGEARKRFDSGKAYTVKGASLRALDAFMLLARAVHLTGTSVLHVDLVALRETMDSQAIEDRTALFVRGFCEDTEPFLPKWETRSIVRYLEEWLDEGRILFPHVISGDYSAWWPETLADNLAARNETIEIGRKA